MIEHLLNSSVTVYRASFVDDGSGGRTRSWASIGSIRAKVGQPVAPESSVASQDGAKLMHVVHVSYGADVERGDELDTGGPRRLRVVAVVNNSRLTYARLECEVLQGG